MSTVNRRPAGVRDAEALLARIRRLELVARKNAAGHLAGDYLTSILGRGLVFHEARRYVAGEPARHIDWNITARTGKPYVRVHEVERQREVFVALDVSPSMHGGLSARSKLETAVELAATLAVAAVDAGDRLGWVLFADRALAVERPIAGRTQLFRALRAFLDATAPWQRPVAESDPRAAIHAIQQTRGSRFVVFLVSDFVDHDVPDDLRYVQARHDVSLFHVYDPAELAAAASGAVVLPAVAAEGLRRNRGPVAPGEVGTLAEMDDFLRREAGRHGISLAHFPTTAPVGATLDRFLAGRTGRRGR